MPNYYKSPQPLEISELYDLRPSQAAALKYILRAGKKPGNTFERDIKKAIHCLVLGLKEDKNDTISIGGVTYVKYDAIVKLIQGGEQKAIPKTRESFIYDECVDYTSKVKPCARPCKKPCDGKCEE